MLQEDTKTLDEVVVVGFGTQKKVNLTGSVGTVDSEALASRPVQNAVQALQGVVPGLQITTTSGALDNKMSMSIRGTGTIGDGSDASPLVLIDGMEGDINSINPQDIENISILKDAAAASIYGSRAPFGVILVTTKSGKSGKTTINYNNNFRWGQPVRIPKQMDSYTFATFYNDANINSGAGAYFNAEHLQRIKDYQDGKITDGVLADANNKYWLDGYAGGNANTDWYDVIYREWTSSQEHNLSFSGGNDKVNYYISGNFMDQKGLMEFNQDTYKRYTGTGKINAQLTDWAKVNYTSRFTREDFHRPAYLTNALFRDLARQGWPTLPVYDPNGYMFHSPSPALPLRDGGKHNIQTDNIYQQISLILEPIKNWITHVDFNYRINTVNNHWDTQTLYNHDVQGNPYPIGYYQDTEAHEDQTKENYMNFNAYTEYSHSLESGHNFKGMIGFQAEEMKQQTFGATRKGIIVPELPEIDITTGLDYTGKVVTPSVNGSRAAWSTAGFFGRINYDYKGKYLAEVNIRYDGTSRFRREQRWNWFPSFSLGWNIARENFWESLSEYVGTLKLRGSYGELGNQNTKSWYPTYQTLGVSAGGGGWIQNGIKPNTATVPGLISSTMGWERIRNWNIGLDFGFFNNRLSGTIDAYWNTTKDLLMCIPIDETTGYSYQYQNIGQTSNKGIEIALNYDILRTKDFTLGVSATYNYNHNNIDELADNIIAQYGSQWASSATTPTYDYEFREGKPVGLIRGYICDGYYTTADFNYDPATKTYTLKPGVADLGNQVGNYPSHYNLPEGQKAFPGAVKLRDLDGNGVADTEDVADLGEITHPHTGGFNLNMTWKDIDFSAGFAWAAGGHVYNVNSLINMYGNKDTGAGANKLEFISDCYQIYDIQNGELVPVVEPDALDALNTGAKYGVPYMENGTVLSTFVEDASFLRLNTLTVGYTFPKAWTKKIGMQRARVYATAGNLFTITGYSGIDPEVNADPNKSTTAANTGNYPLLGMDYGTYPRARTFTFGVNITF